MNFIYIYLLPVQVFSNVFCTSLTYNSGWVTHSNASCRDVFNYNTSWCNENIITNFNITNNFRTISYKYPTPD